jgi:hypothetical protein
MRAITSPASSTCPSVSTDFRTARSRAAGAGATPTSQYAPSDHPFPILSDGIRPWSTCDLLKQRQERRPGWCQMTRRMRLRFHVSRSTTSGHERRSRKTVASVLLRSSRAPSASFYFSSFRLSSVGASRPVPVGPPASLSDRFRRHSGRAGSIVADAAAGVCGSVACADTGACTARTPRAARCTTPPAAGVSPAIGCVRAVQTARTSTSSTAKERQVGLRDHAPFVKEPRAARVWRQRGMGYVGCRLSGRTAG